MRKNNYIKALSILMGSVFMGTVGGSGVSAFNSETHKYVTQSSLGLMNDLSGDLKNHKKILSDLELSILEDLEGQYKNHLIEFSLKPDSDENDGAFKKHFYNPVTEKNFMNEEETALKKCKTHFEAALENFKSGNKEKAYEELGRSIHFLEDLSTCVHTGYDQPIDAIAKLSLHVEFEKTCDAVSSRCKAVIPISSLDYYEQNVLENIAKSVAVLSMDNFYLLENVSLDSQENLASNAVLNAQKKVFGLIYKFIKEAAKSALY